MKKLSKILPGIIIAVILILLTIWFYRNRVYTTCVKLQYYKVYCNNPEIGSGIAYTPDQAQKENPEETTMVAVYYYDEAGNILDGEMFVDEYHFMELLNLEQEKDLVYDSETLSSGNRCEIWNDGNGNMVCKVYYSADGTYSRIYRAIWEYGRLYKNGNWEAVDSEKGNESIALIKDNVELVNALMY